MKRLALALFFLACLGFTAGTLLAPPALAAEAPCENDECEHYWTGDRCITNPGGNTYCDIIDDQGHCKTKGCAPKEE